MRLCANPAKIFPDLNSSTPDLRDNIHSGRDGGRETEPRHGSRLTSDESAPNMLYCVKSELHHRPGSSVIPI
jgi:hypothetical protein